jgi:hypothetical protein
VGNALPNQYYYRGLEGSGDKPSMIRKLQTPLQDVYSRFSMLLKAALHEFENPLWDKEDGDYFINLGIYLQIRYDRNPVYFYALADALMGFNDEGVEQLLLTKSCTLDQVKTTCVYLMVEEEAFFDIRR